MMRMIFWNEESDNGISPCIFLKIVFRIMLKNVFAFLSLTPLMLNAYASFSLWHYQYIQFRCSHCSPCVSDYSNYWRNQCITLEHSPSSFANRKICKLQTICSFHTIFHRETFYYIISVYIKKIYFILLTFICFFFFSCRSFLKSID